MVELVFNAICIFLYYLICIWIYIIYNNRKNKKINKKTKELKKKIEEILEEEINNFNSRDISINKENLDYLYKNIKDKKYQKEVVKALLDFEDRDKLIEFENYTSLVDVVLKDKDKDEFDKAYKIYIIGEFKNQNYYDYLLDNCEDKSIDIQMNILKALINLENEKYFLKGLKKIMKSSSLIHEKVILDSIYSFYEKDECINKLLEKELNNQDEQLSKIIVNHFTNIRYEDAKEEVYKLLKNKNTEKEIKIASIKYFAKVKYTKVKEVLVKLLKDECWEIRAITSTTLANYDCDSVVDALRISIKDEVWYVRQNSARSLYKLLKNKKELMFVINEKDKYASDAIRSILSEEERKKLFFDIDLGFNMDLNKDLEQKISMVSSL